MVISGSLDCSSHEKVELKILRGVRKARSRVQTLHFRKEDLNFFRGLVNEIWWGVSSEVQRSFRELSGLQGLPPSNTRTVHLNTCENE